MTKPFVTAVVLIALCAGLTLGAEKKMILPIGAEPIAGWSFGILTDDTFYVSGMAGACAAVEIPIALQASEKQSLNKIDPVLKRAYMTLF
jgi:enamine deaminase RidA (YjgF/YER057c/UK114 family)